MWAEMVDSKLLPALLILLVGAFVVLTMAIACAPPKTELTDLPPECIKQGTHWVVNVVCPVQVKGIDCIVLTGSRGNSISCNWPK